jgi:hypothetical protein
MHASWLLGRIIVEADPNDDIPFDLVNISEWYEVVATIRRIFGSRRYDNEEYNISAERFDAYSVDITLRRLDLISLHASIDIAKDIQKSLRQFGQYWQVRISIFGKCKDNPTDTELVTWLEIDKYEIYRYLGKVTVERCENLVEFNEWYWKK